MSFLHGQGLYHKYYFYDAQMKTCHINNEKKKKLLSMEQQIEPDKTNLSRFQIIWSFW